MTADWLRLDRNFFHARAAESASTSDAVAYFDGRPPDWRDIVNGIPPERHVVRELMSHLTAPTPGARVGRMVLIQGPSGEGKSTAMMQLAHQLAVGEHGTVLWRQFGGKVTAADLRNIPEGRTFLISDDAEEIAAPIYEFASTDQRPEFTFLVAARTSDWSSVGGKTWPWRSVLGLREVPLRGLDGEDAQLIVSAWERYGPAGLGQLAKTPSADRSSQLVAAAHVGASTNDGALFGGMLTVRFGEFLKDHVRTLLRKLAGQRLEREGTLATALLYVAAAHSLELRLTPNLLAELLGVSSGQVRSDVIAPLEDEAVLTAKHDLVQTRHTRIAGAVLEVARDFNANVAETYAALTRSAIRLGRREFIGGYEEFTYLCRRLERVDAEAAIATSRAATEEDPKILVYVHNLAHVLRVNGLEGDASGVCEYASKRLGTYDAKPHHVRAFFYEWASVEGSCGNPYLSIWLSAISLCDMPNVSEPSSQHIELALAGIGGNMLTLSDQGQSDLKRGVRAAETMSREVTLSHRANAFFSRQRHYADKWGVEPIPKADCVDALRTAVIKAWQDRERTLGELPTAASLSFAGLVKAWKLG